MALLYRSNMALTSHSRRRCGPPTRSLPPALPYCCPLSSLPFFLSSLLRVRRVITRPYCLRFVLISSSSEIAIRPSCIGLRVNPLSLTDHRSSLWFRSPLEFITPYLTLFCPPFPRLSFALPASRIRWLYEPQRELRLFLRDSLLDCLLRFDCSQKSRKFLI